eukprot:5356945-Prymnesium_polylepis.1
MLGLTRRLTRRTRGGTRATQQQRRARGVGTRQTTTRVTRGGCVQVLHQSGGGSSRGAGIRRQQGMGRWVMGMGIS